MPIEGENRIVIIPTRTTVEMKCGAYNTVCTTLLNRPPNSFMISATIMGIGKLNTSILKERIKVFFSRVVK